MKNLPYLLICLWLFGCKENGARPQVRNLNETVTSYPPLPPDQKNRYAEAVYRIYDSLLIKRGFNGGIIIAKNGQVLLEEYRGYADLSTKDTITANTAFHIASVSKTMTGMAVLKLWEQGKLNLDDSLQVYFPGFPYSGITIRMLLNHRSGLPNYVYFMPEDKAWKKQLATNQDMLQFMMEKRPRLYSFPDRSFHYCNTNYALLALIIEKVSGQPYPEFMQSQVFSPLGMKDTYVFSIKDSSSYKPSYGWNNAAILLESMDCVYGDKNIYSTPRDLLKWDDALYSNKFVSEATMKLATEPTSFERPGTHNYGLGWRLITLPNTKIVYHNGWWHGNNSSFTRLVNDTATIIIIGNKFNRAIYSSQKFGVVFDQKADDQVDSEE